ncbi:MAG: RAD55 family ATPase [Candidatus Bilamarchaeum sp.]
MKKIKTGINGLDTLVGGGIPSDSVVLLAGSPGTGKTILSLQFLVSGCKKHKEKGLYISFEERAEKIRDQAKQFGWDLESLEKEGKIKLLTISKLSFGQIYSRIDSTIKSFKPNRLVIDSLTYFTLSARNQKDMVELENARVDEIVYEDDKSQSSNGGWDSFVVRKIMTDLVSNLQSKNICTLMTSETSRSGEWYSRDTLSEFVCDGIIHLKSTSIGSELQRSIEIVKMRNSKIKGGVYSFDFGKNGISILE